jgi:hypothetical protein
MRLYIPARHQEIVGAFSLRSPRVAVRGLFGLLGAWMDPQSAVSEIMPNIHIIPVPFRVCSDYQTPGIEQISEAGSL